MFPRQNQNQFSNSNADVQIFYGDGTSSTFYRDLKSWNKPVGVSHVYMMLIGSGGQGNGATGGGSSAVTVWYGSAQNVPDSLAIFTPHYSSSNPNAYVWARNALAPTTTNFLLRAQGTTGVGAGSADAANQFTASGFFQSVAGQAGTSGAQAASSTTFLSGGGAGDTATGNYGYSTTAPVGSLSGFFILQPIIVGVSSINANNMSSAIGCGGGFNSGKGGPGMVLIASW